ncbi:glycosyltransferase family 2 protein [Asticcacaulis machinosus]|uniref:Glycosyltransferase family 2 protein n=1 Tax=Asticcacaulis machinosus TaxID=2984211 RepID=A0ABT5HLC9_9CAUL|nr:glycosyltransferase family 2 protein [Asticcacaulis machinosus]MDC7677042.1 glycosyltransferase family 2 protein [Asticcacaulis machinosus]
MTESLTFSILVVSYNSAKYLPRCLDALQTQALPRETYEVIVVDNASADFELDAWRARYPAIRFEQFDDNLGFAVANNRAAKMAHAPWLVLINPDAFAHDDMLQALQGAISDHPDVSLFSALQLSANHAGKLDGAGDGMIGFGFNYRMGYGHDIPESLPVGEVFSACGAAMMMRRDLFERLGGFDEDFYIYCEDADLGYRARLLNERCLLIPQARVDHIGSATLGARSDFALRYGYRNRLWMYLKNTPLPVMALTLIPHVLMTIAVMIKDALSGKGMIAGAAVWEALTNLDQVWRKRRDIQRSRRLSSLRLLKLLTWNPCKIARRGVDIRGIDVKEMRQ